MFADLTITNVGKELQYLYFKIGRKIGERQKKNERKMNKNMKNVYFCKRI